MSKRRGLGRGLDALIPPPASGIRQLPVTALRPNRRQPRRAFDDTALGELAASIATQGVVQPIVVTPEEDGYTIVAGERRWRAAQQAGLREVPVVVREVADDREMLELALVENLQRSDLNAIEEAQAYQALAEEFALSQDEIATRVGKARSTVANSLRLLRLPEPVQELLRSGRLAAGQARPLLALERAADQEALAERAVRQGLSARDLERLAARSAKPPRPSPAVDGNTAAAAEQLTRKLQTRVDIRRRGKGGVLAIHFHSEEELMRLYELLVTRRRTG
ncbi:MAG TPA: ParB/RepB/Spo0J family partition protein [Thermoanaerobaculia bacterium]|nr:ParB/RepB/Spo0J family partition protein [Thermoanaerobaculia bacterium]